MKKRRAKVGDRVIVAFKPDTNSQRIFVLEKDHGVEIYMPKGTAVRFERPFLDDDVNRKKYGKCKTARISYRRTKVYTKLVDGELKTVLRPVLNAKGRGLFLAWTNVGDRAKVVSVP